MYNKYIKRIIDIAICIVGFPIFVLLYIVIGLLIKFEDKGPIIYKCDRIGKDGKLFKMYKFRSMNIDSPILLNADGSTYNSKEDSRQTKIGRFIRITSIDETPQILNVFKGDMSISGPRASLYTVLDNYQEDELDKMKVRPGITGFTQAYYRNNLSVKQVKRLRMNLKEKSE